MKEERVRGEGRREGAKEEGGGSGLQITQAKPLLIGALSDENCRGLPPKPLSWGTNQEREEGRG